MPIHILLGSRNLRWPRTMLESSTAPFVDIVYYRKGLLLAILIFTGLFWLVLRSSRFVPGHVGRMERGLWRIASLSCVEFSSVTAGSLNPDIKLSCSG